MVAWASLKKNFFKRGNEKNNEREYNLLAVKLISVVKILQTVCIGSSLVGFEPSHCQCPNPPRMTYYLVHLSNCCCSFMLLVWSLQYTSHMHMHMHICSFTTHYHFKPQWCYQCIPMHPWGTIWWLPHTCSQHGMRGE